MDLSSPIRSVIPSLHGDVLAVLARAGVPMSGRGVASLVEGASPSGVRLALNALVDAGLVMVEPHPPANLYTFNHRHLAAPAVAQLVMLRSSLVAALDERLGSWNPAAWGAWLFGSAARGDGSTSSDVDVLLVRPGSVDADDRAWVAQVDALVDDVRAWTGNACSVVEYSHAEFSLLMDSDERLASELRADGVELTSRALPRKRSRRPAALSAS